MTRTKGLAVGLLAVLVGSQATSLMAQSTASATTTLETTDKPPLSPAELEQMMAPIALYPDDLLTQILMASTYPLEIVQAERWAQANKDLKGDAFAKELEKQSWDPSVKSIINVPSVLKMMSDNLDLTIKVGDAFIAQQADVLNTIQKLRSKAQSAGNLKDSEQQKVVIEAAPAPEPAAAAQTVIVQVPPSPQIIKIESPDPSVIYVPTYSPTVVYGTWPYPAYPPYPYYPPHPPGYVATAAISFGLGVAAGAAWGYAWGNCNWGRNNVDIDVNRNTNINKNINRNKYQQNINRNDIKGGGGKGSWQHNPAHRQGVAYPNQRTAQQFGGANQSGQAAKARDAFRGRADTGRQNLGGGGTNRPSTGAIGGGGTGSNRPNTGAVGGGANRPNTGGLGGGAGNRPNTGAVGGGAQNRASTGKVGGGAANRPSTGAVRSSAGTKSSALSGVNSGGGAARSASQRGAASRKAPAARSAPSRGARSGGGGGGRRR
jgi:Protein of unknown function (DUF3300)